MNYEDWNQILLKKMIYIRTSRKRTVSDRRNNTVVDYAELLNGF